MFFSLSYRRTSVYEVLFSFINTECNGLKKTANKACVLSCIPPQLSVQKRAKREKTPVVEVAEHPLRTDRKVKACQRAYALKNTGYTFPLWKNQPAF